ncbi:PAS domain-containing sensor histidine kinase [Cytobacillus gottheilii]|uniref:PAS domain-containing sensor histidine kinase n=1 Tax=Cytobacillus gottheilii TaxID=859144 RepID=UPI0009B99FB4|nr:PAS domain-containing sensor histidine kinase [Cytobacillus gottheilii]
MNKKKIIGLYCIAGLIWIFGTNYILEQFEPSPFLQFITSSKEVLYIVLTGLLFYYFIKKTEELNKSREEEKRLSTLINSMVDFVNFKDGKGRWIEANEFGLKLFDLEHVDYKGKTDSELAEYTGFYREALIYCEESDEAAWQYGTISRVEEVIPTKDGGTKTFDTIKVPLFNKNGSRQGLVIIGRDITDRIEVERLLEETKQQYKSLFEYNTGIIIMTDLDGQITQVNPQFIESTQFTEDEVKGKCLSNFIKGEQQSAILAKINEMDADPLPQISEIELTTKSDEKISLECNILPIVINEKTAGIIVQGKDITKLRMTEEKLRLSEKLSAVGELSASIAHEIRNPLTSLKGFVQLLESENEKHRFYYRIMQEELDRINYIVSELLLLAKPQEVRFVNADIQTILFNVTSLLKTEATLFDVVIDLKKSKFPAEIECEPNQLKQLFINIIKNAIEASISGGKVTISFHIEENEAVISIKDTGVGISADSLKKLGQPFYSSKETGTGLGLTVSYRIVQLHRGTMTFNSKVSEGTEVLIRLPLTRSSQ